MSSNKQLHFILFFAANSFINKIILAHYLQGERDHETIGQE